MKKSIQSRLYPTLEEASHAAQALGIMVKTEYNKRYKEDPRLPSNPQCIYVDKWQSWPIFLGQYDRIKNYYSTLEEASRAVQALSITTVAEYNKRYKEDPRLPSNPQSVYVDKWQSWPIFFGQNDRRKHHYSTLEEASRAAQALGIITSIEYNKRYKEDPRLPSAPLEKYADEWQNWSIFLGQYDRIKNLYSTLEEASHAAQALGIMVKTEYNKRYKEDPRLPSNPQCIYVDKWQSWPIFLGQYDRIKNYYSTLEEASRAAQTLGIMISIEYNKRYKEDPRLPREPQRVYADKWQNWLIFLGQYDRIKNFYSTLEEAAHAAQALNITTVTEYSKRYKEDRGLPNSPQSVYADEWQSWPIFLGQYDRIKNLYSTLEEASHAAQALGIMVKTEYNKRYKEDPRLPSNPLRIYVDKWQSWPIFLGQYNRRKHHYATLEEASRAAQALNITTVAEYNKRYKEDPRLPSNPQRVYADEWQNWPVFLGQYERIKNFYSTLEEASHAAQTLNITTVTEYSKRYKEDPRLPSNPQRVYADEWQSLPIFLGQYDRIKNLYSTLEEASRAAQALNITTATEYNKRYKEDRGLPSEPKRTYVDEWQNWSVFLGQYDRRKGFYPTLEQASSAAQALGIMTYSEYNKRYKEDPRLLSSPQRVYADKWQSWSLFFGIKKPFYPTLEEAAYAAQVLGITTMIEYKKRYKEDRGLPNNPHRIYVDEWQNWRVFLNTDISSEPLRGAFAEFAEFCPEWKSAVERYVEESRGQTNKISHLRPFINEIVIPSGCVDWPGVFLHTDTVFPKVAFEAYVNATGDTQKKSRFNACLYFLDWILEEYCSEENDNGELERLPGYRNPIAVVMGHLAGQFQPYRPSESTKPVLPLTVIERAKRHLIPPGCTTFSELSGLHDYLSDAWFEVDPSIIDKNDPDCIWRKIQKDRKRKGERYREIAFEIWSPVKLVALYTLLRVPLRGQQICWLDSGEADTEIPVMDGNEIKWVENDSVLGKYNKNQSFIRNYPNDSPGMFVTTNKTGGKSYSVPYMPDDLAYWIIRLREWQAKYNPLTAPTPWTKIDLRQKINKDVLRSRGTQTFLFRDPCNRSGNRHSPMQTTTAFTRSLPSLLFAIQQPSEELATIDYTQSKKGILKSQFTTHSLRTSLITALLVDGGARAETLMKLVGHATIVMTLYYAKIGPSKMFQELEEAEKRALECNTDRLKDLAFTKQIEAARSDLIATDSSLLGQLDASWPSAAYQFMDIGLCPMSGQGCDQGGAAVVERSAETIYAPVEAGYLGKRNCPRCRFFVTGPAWLGGLQALVNQILVEVNAVKAEYHELVEEQQRLEDDKFDAEREGRQFDNMKAFNQTTAVMEERGQKLDVLLTDFQHVYRLMRQCIALLNKEGSGENAEVQQQLIVSENGFMHMALDESDSEFRLLASVCNDAEIYQSASASRATPKLAQMIDSFAEMNGFSPGLYRLTETQQRKAVNQIAKLLLKRFEGDWSITEKIVKGDLTLDDLSLEESLVPLRSEIANALLGDEKSLLKLEDQNVES